jgi:hypothetical protein
MAAAFIGFIHDAADDIPLLLSYHGATILSNLPPF